MFASRSWLRKLQITFALVCVLSLLTSTPAMAQARHGVDDLRGLWRITVQDLGAGPLLFDILICDIEPDPQSETGADYLAVGCLVSDEDAATPLSLRATALGDGVYEVSILGTAAYPSYGSAFVIQFLGTVTTNGKGVPDDVAGGSVRTEFDQDASWSGAHHDRRRPHCPPMEEPIPGLFFEGDAYLHREYDGTEITSDSTTLEGHTNIVSTAMRVEWPDGTVVDVPMYTDIFSPFVDFISRFRYCNGYPGTPLTGSPYRFTLLDALGNPIPGTLWEDTWTACLTFPPPLNVSGTVMSGMDIALQWNAVPVVPGFDPPNGYGFYQIEIGPWDFEASTNYGANGVQSTTHLVPWNGFGGWAPGTPDGQDNGCALSELDNGNYALRVQAFSLPDPAGPGFRLECCVWDRNEFLFLTKTDAGVSFFTP